MTTADQRVSMRNRKKRRNQAVTAALTVLTVGSIPVAVWLIPFPGNLAVAIPLVAVAILFGWVWKNA